MGVSKKMLAHPYRVKPYFEGSKKTRQKMVCLKLYFVDAPIRNGRITAAKAMFFEFENSCKLCFSRKRAWPAQQKLAGCSLQGFFGFKNLPHAV